MKCLLFTCLLFAGFMMVANAQSVDFYGNPVASDICAQYGMKDDKEALDCMDKICAAAGIPNNFLLLPCPNVDNCFALYKDGVAYIVYDIAFFNKVKTFGFTDKNLPKNNVDWAALTILAHELGHHLCQHTTNKLVREKYTPVQMELQADEFAGTILYRLGATLVQAQLAMNNGDVPDEATLSHPARKDRLDAIARGYNSEMKKYADRNVPAANPALPNNPAKNYEAVKNGLKQAGDYFGANNYAACRDVYKAMDEADLDGTAWENLGYMYMNGYSVTKDYAQAKACFEKAADKGTAFAMTNLGFLYQNGLGVQQDYAMAKTWYEKGANKGEQTAVFNLGVLYYNGWGVLQDYALAKTWYEKAASLGNAKAMDNIGILYLNGQGAPQDYALAKTWFEKAANGGERLASFNMGILYANGYGVKQDYALAKTWYEKAANAGEPLAFLNIGNLYTNGYGVMQDYALARTWYEKAANAGNAKAMTNIGFFYLNGYGVPLDYALAKTWLEKAANLGDPTALSDIGVLYLNGYGVTRDYALAKAWFEKAANAGDAAAMAYIGDLYANGQGVGQDYTEAKLWYDKACGAGSATGCPKAKEIAKKL